MTTPRKGMRRRGKGGSITTREFRDRITEHHQWLQEQPEGNRADFTDLDLTDVKWDREFDVSGACFAYAKLNRLTLYMAGSAYKVDFTGTDFRGARLRAGHSRNVVFLHCSFINARGLFGPRRWSLLRGHSFSTDRSNPCRTGIKTLRDFPAWHHLRGVGLLPVFGVSNVAFIGLLTYSGAARWYNHQIDRLQVKLDAGSESTLVPVEQGADDFLRSLTPAPSPDSFGWLLISIALLILASTWFSLRCPEEVRGFSISEWIDSPDRDELQWLAADTGYRVSRWACLVCYAIGGGIAVIYLVSRLVEGIVFFLTT